MRADIGKVVKMSLPATLNIMRPTRDRMRRAVQTSRVLAVDLSKMLYPDMKVSDPTQPDPTKRLMDPTQKVKGCRFVWRQRIKFVHSDNRTKPTEQLNNKRKSDKFSQNKRCCM